MPSAHQIYLFSGKCGRCFVCDLVPGLGTQAPGTARKGRGCCVTRCTHWPTSADTFSSLSWGEGKQHGAEDWICTFLLLEKVFNSSVTLLAYIIAELVFIIVVWVVSILNYRFSCISRQSCEHCVKSLCVGFFPHVPTIVNFLPIIQYSKMDGMVRCKFSGNH